MERTNIGFCIENDRCRFGVRVVVNSDGEAKLEYVELLDNSIRPADVPELPIHFTIDKSKASEVLGFLPAVSSFLKNTYPDTSVKLMWQFNRSEK